MPTGVDVRIAAHQTDGRGPQEATGVGQWRLSLLLLAVLLTASSPVLAESAVHNMINSVVARSLALSDGTDGARGERANACEWLERVAAASIGERPYGVARGYCLLGCTRLAESVDDIPGLPSSTLWELYWRGRIAFDDGRIEEAREQWRQAGLDMLIAATLYREGVKAFQEGRRSAAEELWWQCVTLDPTHGEAQYWLGQLYWGMGNPEESEKAFASAILYLDTEGYPWFVAKGKLALMRRDWGAAAEAFRLAYKLKPQDSSSLLHWGRALVRMQNLEQAKTVFLMAQRLDPSDISSYVELGDLCLAQAAWECAIDQFEQGLQISPGSRDLWMRLSRAYRGAGDLESALEAEKRGLSGGS